MPQMICGRPIGELDFCNKPRLHPSILLQNLSRKCFALPRALRLGQIVKRADRSFQAAKALEHLRLNVVREPVLNLCNEDQLSVLVVVPYRQVIEVILSHAVTTNDELLPLVDSILEPIAAALSRFVSAIGAFGNDALQALRLNGWN